MKKGDVIRQKCVNTTFYLTGILAHKVNNRLINLEGWSCHKLNRLLNFLSGTFHLTY